MRAVITLVFYDGDLRKGFTMYSRNAIDNLNARIESGGPLIDGIVSAYLGSSPGRQGITKVLLGGQMVAWVPGWPLIHNLCNMDPSAYHQPILFFMVRLIDYYSLSFTEPIGLQTAYEFCQTQPFTFRWRPWHCSPLSAQMIFHHVSGVTVLVI